MKHLDCPSLIRLISDGGVKLDDLMGELQDIYKKEGNVIIEAEWCWDYIKGFYIVD